MAERCVAKVGGCCNPYKPAAHCSLADDCDLLHHKPEPPRRCDRVEGSHAGGALGHTFAEAGEGVPV